MAGSARRNCDGDAGARVLAFVADGGTCGADEFCCHEAGDAAHGFRKNGGRGCAAARSDARSEPAAAERGNQVRGERQKYFCCGIGGTDPKTDGNGRYGPAECRPSSTAANCTPASDQPQVFWLCQSAWGDEESFPVTG